jgi:hypothetical protein|uniref:Uncharacterized protein n=1 Tax=viral metagenome TaxID=1070528 RepID=A0A6C0BQJ6_9ZZZZ
MNSEHNFKNWFFLNEKTVDEIYNVILKRIKNDVYINHPISLFNINEDKLYDNIVQYMFKVSNNKNKHLYRMR